jgi:hypothetical protein
LHVDSQILRNLRLHRHAARDIGGEAGQPDHLRRILVAQRLAAQDQGLADGEAAETGKLIEDGFRTLAQEEDRRLFPGRLLVAGHLQGGGEGAVEGGVVGRVELRRDLHSTLAALAQLLLVIAEEKGRAGGDLGLTAVAPVHQVRQHGGRLIRGKVSLQKGPQVRRGGMIVHQCLLFSALRQAHILARIEALGTHRHAPACDPAK